jgi:hypothetical protein
MGNVSRHGAQRKFGEVCVFCRGRGAAAEHCIMTDAGKVVEEIKRVHEDDVRKPLQPCMVKEHAPPGRGVRGRLPDEHDHMQVKSTGVEIKINRMSDISAYKLRQTSQSYIPPEVEDAIRGKKLSPKSFNFLIVLLAAGTQESLFGGLLTEIIRAYVVVDNRFYMWIYEVIESSA